MAKILKHLSMIFQPGKAEYDFKEGQVLLIDKPLEWTSFDVVNKIRYLIRHKYQYKKLKVGHAGTLDPLATGLLILCTGKFTKQINTFQAETKTYETTIKLGATTPSFDREMEEDAVYPTEHINLALVQEALKGFIGEQEQVAPIFSAKKVDGERAYIAARKGKEIELKSHVITIFSIDILDFTSPNLRLKIVCSKGTYIRSLARDIGKALNSGGYLTDLRRTQSGEFQVDEAIGVLEFEKIINDLKLI